jgi:hypothetical protein
MLFLPYADYACARKYNFQSIFHRHGPRRKRVYFLVTDIFYIEFHFSFVCLFKLGMATSNRLTEYSIERPNIGQQNWYSISYLLNLIWSLITRLFWNNMDSSIKQCSNIFTTWCFINNYQSVRSSKVIRHCWHITFIRCIPLPYKRSLNKIPIQQKGKRVK